MTTENTCSAGPSGSSPSATSSSQNGVCQQSDDVTQQQNGCSDSNQMMEILEVEPSVELIEMETNEDSSSLPPFITGSPENNEVTPGPLDTSFEDMLVFLGDDRPPPKIDLMVVQPNETKTETLEVKPRRKKSFPGPISKTMMKQIPSCAIPKLPKSFFDSFYISSSEDEKTKEEAAADPPRRKRMFLSKQDRVILASFKSPKPSTSAVLERERESFKKKFPETPSFRGVRKDSARSSGEGRGIPKRSLPFNLPAKKVVNKKAKREESHKQKAEENGTQHKEQENQNNQEKVEVKGEPKALKENPPAVVVDSKTESSDEEIEFIAIVDAPAVQKKSKTQISDECQTAPLEKGSTSVAKSRRFTSLNLPSRKTPPNNESSRTSSSSPSELPVKKTKTLPPTKNCSIRLTRLDASKLPMKISKPLNIGGETKNQKRPAVSDPSESDSEEENLFQEVSATELKRIWKENATKSVTSASTVTVPESLQNNDEQNCPPDVEKSTNEESLVSKLTKEPSTSGNSDDQNNSKDTPSPNDLQTENSHDLIQESASIATEPNAETRSPTNENDEVLSDKLQNQNANSPMDCEIVPPTMDPTKSTQTTVSTQTEPLNEIEAAILAMQFLKGEARNEPLTRDIEVAIVALQSLKSKMGKMDSGDLTVSSNGHSPGVCNGIGKPAKRIKQSELKNLVIDHTSNGVVKNGIISCDESSDQRRSARAKKPRFDFFN